MGDRRDRIGALRYGADDYVVKPYPPGEMVACVRAVLRRSTGRSPLCWQGMAVNAEAMTVTFCCDMLCLPCGLSDVSLSSSP
ncbi:hypothetical protein PANPA_00368 (plasmid) [Pantoea sp. Nvir]